RPTYKYNPRMIPARSAAPLSLENQDVCILVNCSLKPKLNVDSLPGAFVDALEPFVRSGRGLVIFGGDNVDAEAYNATFGDKLKLLPAALKPAVKAGKKKEAKGDETEPFLVNRTSFGDGPSAFWQFKDDLYYQSFDLVQIFRHLDVDE